MSEHQHLQIGEVAARTQLSIKTIRHYDDVGLAVPSARSSGGFRLYTAGDVERLLTIRRMKPLGFSLEQMRDLLAALDTLETGSTSEREEAVAHLAACRAQVDEACRKLSAQLAYAHELAAQLADFVERA